MSDQTWAVMGSDGVTSGEGMTEARAYRAAQDNADRTGQTWYVYDASVPEIPAYEVAPAGSEGKTYYAVCNVNGPISVELDGDTEAEALASFAALDTRKAIDDARTDLEDALDIEGADMSEEAFAKALDATGCAEHVRSLDEVVNAHAGTVAHLANGWTLWSVCDAG